MIQKVNIKKDTPDSFDSFGGYSGSNLEDKSRIEVIGSGNLSRALEIYQSNFEIVRKGLSSCYFERLYLDPFEINDFLQLTKAFEDERCYNLTTSRTLTHFIKLSYSKGNTSFELDAEGFPEFNGFCKGVYDTKKGRLNMVYNGNLGSNSFGNSNKIDLIVNGNVGSGFAWKAYRNSFLINGYVGKSNFKGAINCDITVNGTMESIINSDSSHLTLKLNGVMNPLDTNQPLMKSGLFDTKIIVSNLNEYKKLRNQVRMQEFRRFLYPLEYPMRKGNQLIFVNENGEQKRRRRFV